MKVSSFHDYLNFIKMFHMCVPSRDSQHIVLMSNNMTLKFRVSTFIILRNIQITVNTFKIHNYILHITK